MIEALTTDQRDAAAEYGMAAYALMTVRGPTTPVAVWRRYTTTKADLARLLEPEVRLPEAA